VTSWGAAQSTFAPIDTPLAKFRNSRPPTWSAPELSSKSPGFIADAWRLSSQFDARGEDPG
jgi:hypothetical protein